MVIIINLHAFTAGDSHPGSCAQLSPQMTSDNARYLLPSSLYALVLHLLICLHPGLLSWRFEPRILWSVVTHNGTQMMHWWVWCHLSSRWAFSSSSFIALLSLLFLSPHQLTSWHTGWPDLNPGSYDVVSHSVMMSGDACSWHILTTNYHDCSGVDCSDLRHSWNITWKPQHSSTL